MLPVAAVRKVLKHLLQALLTSSCVAAMAAVVVCLLTPCYKIARGVGEFLHACVCVLRVGISTFVSDVYKASYHCKHTQRLEGSQNRFLCSKVIIQKLQYFAILHHLAIPAISIPLICTTVGQEIASCCRHGHASEMVFFFGLAKLAKVGGHRIVEKVEKYGFRHQRCVSTNSSGSAGSASSKIGHWCWGTAVYFV